MAAEGAARFVRYERSRNLVYISKEVAGDTSFPFKPGEELWARIDGKRLIVEKIGARPKK